MEKFLADGLAELGPPDEGMFYIKLSIWDHSIKFMTKCIYVLLCSVADKDGVIEINRREFAKEQRVSLKQLDKAISDLIELGFISKL